MRLRSLPVVLLVCMLAFGVVRGQEGAGAAGTAAARPGLIGAEEAGKILPAMVFFRGLSAPVQARNSGGVRFADGRMMLVSLVDTAGYSTQVKDKYQAYLITERAIELGGRRLAPGAYGCGFVAGDTFIVQDVGAHDLFTVASVRDAGLRRPTPLQVVASDGGGYRLYAGRSYVMFRLVE